MYNAKSLKAEEFISDEEIRETLAYADANKDNVALIDGVCKPVTVVSRITYQSENFPCLCICDHTGARTWI